jgi:hypothetical protein
MMTAHLDLLVAASTQWPLAPRSHADSLGAFIRRRRPEDEPAIRRTTERKRYPF